MAAMRRFQPPGRSLTRKLQNKQPKELRIKQKNMLYSNRGERSRKMKKLDSKRIWKIVITTTLFVAGAALSLA